MPLRYSFQASKTGPNVKKAPQQAPQPQLASKPAPKQPVPVLEQPQEQGGPCGSTPPSTVPKAKQQSKADADKVARDELMQCRDWSYKDGYKPRWIIYCTTAIAPMIVEGAEIKPAGARRAPQDHVAVIIPNDQWSPSQQGEEEEEEDDWSEFMPSCQVFSARSKAYEELDKWQSWWETYEPDEIVDLNPDPKTMRMSPSKPPTPKKKQPQGDPPAQPPAPPQEDEGPAEAAAQAEAPAAAAQEEEAPAPAAAAQEEDAPAPPQEEEEPAAAPQEGETTEGEGAAPKEEEAPEGATPEGDPSAQEQGDTAPAAAGAEDQRPEWEKEWEAEVVVESIKEITG